LKTADKLQTLTQKDLAQLAKKKGVAGWHDMRKDQLLRALSKLMSAKPAAAKAPIAAVKKSAPAKGLAPAAKAKSSAKVSAARAPVPSKAPVLTKAPVLAKTPVLAKASSNGHVKADKVLAAKRAEAPAPVKVAAAVASANGHAKSNGHVATPVVAVAKPKVKERPKHPVVVKRIKEAKERMDRRKNLAYSTGDRFVRDRLVVMVRDPYWLHAYWELTRQGVQRAEAALGQEWHLARPVLRLYDVTSNGTTSTSETVLRNIDIHGGVNNWYIDVADPPKTYRVDVGYLTASGKFFQLARSNMVSTPRAGASDSLDENWTDVAENFEKIYAMSGGFAIESNGSELQELFEERLRRPMNTSVMSRFSSNGADPAVVGRTRDFNFQVDAELIVYGSTESDARVTLQGDPVQLRPDGTFTVRFAMPNCRQVIPAVAASADGVEQRTIVLAVERNTKVMEPVSRDSSND
jgi:hypothetical protein